MNFSIEFQTRIMWTFRFVSILTIFSRMIACGAIRSMFHVPKHSADSIEHSSLFSMCVSYSLIVCISESLCLQIYFLIVPDCVYIKYIPLATYGLRFRFFDSLLIVVVEHFLFIYNGTKKKKTITYGQHWSLPKLKNRNSSEMLNTVCVFKAWFIPDEYNEPNTQKPEITAQVAESNLNQSTWYIISVVNRCIFVFWGTWEK